MIMIGLTGGIGSGKSTVAAMLVKRGAILIDADLIVRELQEPGEAVFEAIVERWGQSVLHTDGSLNRSALAELVFSDEAELEALNAIVHPAVWQRVEERKAEVEESESIVVLDVPLLVRADGSVDEERYGDLDEILVIDVPGEVAVDRLIETRGFTEDDAKARIARQASRSDRLAAADFVIDNSGSLADLDVQVGQAWKWMSELVAAG